MTTMTKMTPMLQQYLEIKEQHSDSILFYRMGDFYEMFFDDAVEASKILGITLTSRNKKSDPVQVPMCGIPYHAVQNYLGKLIKAGRRVAICEQVEDPADAKGIVKREVIKVVSPGVVTDGELLDDKSNNYLSCLFSCSQQGATSYGLSFLDVSTGEFLVGEYQEQAQGISELLDQLSRLQPAELVVETGSSADLRNLLQQIKLVLPELCLTERESIAFDFDSARDLLFAHFKVVTFDGFGLARYSAGIISAGILLEYVQDTQKTAVDHIEKLTAIETGNILHIDESSRRNLELTQTIVGAQRSGSLLSVLDKTCTPMGARLLKHNLLFPLQDISGIISRLDAVTYFYRNSAARRELRTFLEQVYDLERLNGRMILGSGNARDMLAMKQSLANLPAIFALLQACDTEKLIEIRCDFDLLEDLHELLEHAIYEEAPITLRDGNLIREGYNAELDELRHILRDGKKLILELEAKERNATGLAKLKIGFNKVFGYFIEVGKAHAEKVPEHYIRKQTLVNAERFITPELKDFENKVLGAQDRSTDLEYQLFLEIREKIAANSSRLLTTARLLAELDFFASAAEVAHHYNYRRPEIHTGTEISITEGRHPVIERSLPSGKFVPNDILLDQEQNELLIITGPNMAGKSTVLRQTALVVLMAQMGSFVPAEKASIGIVDRIFTRVGAMDNLRLGQSTFMVEMSETANILNNATDRSLVILDEIGRGTSTYDGLSIAWAVAEDLVQKNERGVKTLFATHYHELTEMARNHGRVQNFSIAVREWQDNIIFLHKLVRGGASRSYGIQVAALAGVPEKVVQRANEILKDIERGSFLQTGGTERREKKVRTKTHPGQLSLFAPPKDKVREKLQSLQVEACTPLEALNLLAVLKDMVQKHPE